MNENYAKETICIQSGWKPKNGEPRILPIYQSTTFKYDSSEQMGKLFDLEAEGYFYTRLQNPTNDFVAKKICELEGGVAAMLTSSGQAANYFAVFNICEAGDHVIMSSSVYGGTYNLLTVTMKKMGIECSVVDPDDDIDTLSKAKKEIIIIDNYAGKKLFDIIRNINVKVKIYTENIDNISKEKYEKQYSNIEIINTNIFHDRFIIIDNKVLYHSGTSFKDLGKKCFAITKIVDNNILEELLDKLEK